MRNEIAAWDGLTAQSAQMLLCDLQEGIVARSKTTGKEALAQSTGVLLELAKLFGLPVTMSVVPEGEKAPKLIPELRDSGFAQEKLRASASPFTDTATVSTLAQSGRKLLILAGVVTEVVVLHAALDARLQGYEVLIPVDACGGLSDRTENAAFRQAEAAGAVTTSVVSIATKLTPDFTTDLGKQMFGIVQKLRFG